MTVIGMAIELLHYPAYRGSGGVLGAGREPIEIGSGSGDVLLTLSDGISIVSALIYRR